MGRQLRIEYPGAHYHVTSRGNERRDVFKSQKDREKFISYLESAVVRYGAVIHAYCLMSTHFHILIETPSGNLSQIMQHINGAYTIYFNAKRKRSGHLFQGRYKAILIEADEYALELSRYIHLNPVRAGMVARPEEYRWSSYRDYVGERKSPEWLKTGFVLGYFGKKASDSADKYRKFVEDRLGEEYDSPLNAAVAATMLGGAEFIREMTEKHIDGKQLDRDLAAVRTLSNHPTVDTIVQAVKSVIHEHERLAVKASIYLCHKYSGAKLKEIGERFEIGQSAVTQASRRFAQQLDDDGTLKKQVDKIVHSIDLSKRSSRPVSPDISASSAFTLPPDFAEDLALS